MSARSAFRFVRWFVGLGVLVSLAAGGYYAYAALDQPVTRVRIDGAVDPAERAQVEKIVNTNLEGGVLSADVHAIADGLRALGWTRDVSVRRVWPDCIEVSLTHSVPIARWNRTRLLGDDGRSYAYVGQQVAPNLPNLYGPTREALEVVRHYRVLRAIFEPAGLLVTRTGQDEKGNWSMELDGKIDVLLGNRDVLDRAQRVVDLYRRHLEAERDRIERVDARYANGVAVAWTNVHPADGAIGAATAAHGTTDGTGGAAAADATGAHAPSPAAATNTNETAARSATAQQRTAIAVAGAQ